MSVNKEIAHVVVIPEDQADRELANGFKLRLAEGANIGIVEEAGGWMHVIDVFCDAEVPRMRKYPLRHVVLLIDFDGDASRRAFVNGKIPDELASRVFVLGSWTDPQDLKRQLNGTLEEIGSALAEECRTKRWTTWEHPLLLHNAEELNRLIPAVHPILF